VFNSLTKKMLGTVILISAICTVSFSVTIFYVLEGAVTRQMESDGRALVTSIKRQIVSNNITDTNEIREIFKELKEQSKGNIIYMSITDDKQNILVSSDDERVSGNWKTMLQHLELKAWTACPVQQNLKGIKTR